MLRLVILVMVHLPELIRIIDLLEKRNKEFQTERKIKDDLKEIETAFKNNDAESLKRIFNS